MIQRVIVAEYEKIVVDNDQVPSEKKIFISREELEKPSNKLLRWAKVPIYNSQTELMSTPRKLKRIG